MGREPTHPNAEKLAQTLMPYEVMSAHYRHLSTEVVLNLPGLDCIWCMFSYNLEKFCRYLVSTLIDEYQVNIRLIPMVADEFDIVQLMAI